MSGAKGKGTSKGKPLLTLVEFEGKTRVGKFKAIYRALLSLHALIEQKHAPVTISKARAKFLKQQLRPGIVLYYYSLIMKDDEVGWRGLVEKARLSPKAVVAFVAKKITGGTDHVNAMPDNERGLVFNYASGARYSLSLCHASLSLSIALYLSISFSLYLSLSRTHTHAYTHTRSLSFSFSPS